MTVGKNGPTREPSPTSKTAVKGRRCLAAALAFMAVATLGSSVAAAEDRPFDAQPFPPAHQFAPQSCTVEAPLFGGVTNGVPVMSPQGPGQGRFLEHLQLWVGISPEGTVYFAEFEPGRKESISCAAVAQLPAIGRAWAVSLTAEEVASPMSAVRVTASVMFGTMNTLTTVVLARASIGNGGWLSITADTVDEPIRARCGDDCAQGSSAPLGTEELTGAYREMKKAMAAKQFDTVEMYSSQAVRLPDGAMALAPLWAAQGRLQRAVAALVLAGINGRGDAGVALGDLFWASGRVGFAPKAYQFALDHWPAGQAVPARARLRTATRP